MAIRTIGSTSTVFRATRVMGASSTTPSSSTTSTVKAKARTLTASKTVSSSSAKAKATSSTTVRYSSASSTAKVSSTTASVKTTKTSKVSSTVSNKATSRVSSTTASTTAYPYLAHLGSNAHKEIEQILVDLGLDKKVDGNFAEGMKKFKTAAGMGKYSTYGTEVVAKLNKVSKEIKADDDFMQQLQELGFYNKDSDNVEAESVKADSAPCDVFKAMENFCNLYNVEYNLNSMDKIFNKIDEVYTYYKDIYNSDKTDKILSSLFTEDPIQQVNFCKSWTFLKVGMGFSDELAAGVLGNWFEEGAFSETNGQDSKGYKELDDSMTYQYNDEDWVGFGIMQWTDDERKGQFLETAKRMNSGVGNINVQFALFRDEISEGGTQHGYWKKVLAGNDYDSYARLFMLNVERPLDKSEEKQLKRVDNAKKIYEGMVY